MYLIWCYVGYGTGGIYIVFDALTFACFMVHNRHVLDSSCVIITVHKVWKHKIVWNCHVGHYFCYFLMQWTDLQSTVSGRACNPTGLDLWDLDYGTWSNPQSDCNSSHCGQICRKKFYSGQGRHTHTHTHTHRERERQTDRHTRMGILGLVTVHRTSARQARVTENLDRNLTLPTTNFWQLHSRWFTLLSIITTIIDHNPMYLFVL